MLKFSKKVEYALISLLHMAEQHSDQLTTSRELAAHFNIPPELIGKVLQSLAKHDCIRSVQGVRGGYQLAKNPDQINLANVIQAVEGPIRVVNCISGTEQCGCDQMDFCNIRNPMERLQFKLIEAFNRISLKDIQANNFTIDILPGSYQKNVNVSLNITNN